MVAKPSNDSSHTQAASKKRPRSRTGNAETNDKVIEALEGIPPAMKSRLRGIGIHRWADFLMHFPLRYEDETLLTPWEDVQAGEPVHVEVEVTGHEILYRPRRTLRVFVAGGLPKLSLRFLHFFPSQLKQFEPGTRLRINGECRMGFNGPEFVHPRYRVIQADTPLETTLTPVYPTTTGVSQTALRRWIQKALHQAPALQDTLPEVLRNQLGLLDFKSVLYTLHTPPAGSALQSLEDRTHPAWQRLKFDELLAQQLSMRKFRNERSQLIAPVLNHQGPLLAAFKKQLPFTLTHAQQKALDEISHDMGLPHPMQRLLQGDVGSGKTIVAALACAQAIDHGYQAVLLAPTEILASQHFSKIAALLEPLSVQSTWLTGSQKKRERESALQALADGTAQLAIGTHALLEDPVLFKRLGLVVIDEQHRFGVEQRLALRRKAELAGTGHPHQLMMSATPIPRTLSMSFFADLDVSVIDALPPGRTPIQTRLVEAARRSELFARLDALCQSGEQAYWVCPLIEESEALDLQTAIDTCAQLQMACPKLRIGLLHGRLPNAEKTSVMQAFSRGEIQVLVATTVVEVGVDVPNATLMVIEHAERMGLAQLHQLRGRVGRGGKQGWCILLYHKPLSETARDRLKVIFEHTDGFEIARQDLRIRGPGEFLGARQSGTPLLRFADLETDLPLLEQARDWADRLWRDAPDIAEKHLDRWLGHRGDYLRA